MRALEGEIARTIQAMKGVKAARVHIVLPDGGSFRRNRQPPSASVDHAHRDRPDDFSAAPGHPPPGVGRGARHDRRPGHGAEHGRHRAGRRAATPPTPRPARWSSLEKTRRQGAAGQHPQDARPLPRRSTISRSASRRASTPTSARPTRPSSTRNRASSARCGSSRRPATRRTPTTGRRSASSRTSRPSRRRPRPATSRSDPTSAARSSTNYELSSKTISTVSEGYRIENLTVAVVINRKRLLASLGEKATPEAVDKQLQEIERLVGLGRRRRLQARRPRHGVGGRVRADAARRWSRWPGLGIVEQLLRRPAASSRRSPWSAAAALLIWFGLRPAMRAMLEQPRPPSPVRPVQPLSRRRPGGAAAERMRVAREEAAQPDRRSDEQARAHAAEAARADDRVRRGAGGGHPQAVDAAEPRRHERYPTGPLSRGFRLRRRHRRRAARLVRAIGRANPASDRGWAAHCGGLGARPQGGPGGRRGANCKPSSSCSARNSSSAWRPSAVPGSSRKRACWPRADLGDARCGGEHCR